MTASTSKRRSWTRAAALSLLLIAACTINPATGQRQLALMSEGQEIAMGRQSHPEVLATFGAYDSPEWQRYIQEIGAELAALSERPQLDWTFTVLDDPVVNAMALPGGFVYVNRGILAHFNSEAELASVLGHEIGHVTARHSVEQISRAQLAQISLGVAAVASEDFRPYAGLAAQGVGLLFLKFGRDDERQSDHLGMRYMTRAGYDPSEMPKVFATLGRISQSQGLRPTPQWLSTHPDPGNRVADMTARIAEMPPGQRQGAVNREEYLRRLEGMVFGDDPRQGYALGRTYYHPVLAFKIDFPDQWRIINQRQQVAAVSPDQDAAVVLSLSDEASPNAAFETFFGQRGIERGPSRGRNLFAFRALDSETGVPAVEGLIGYLLHDGRLYQLIGYTEAGVWSSYAAATERSLTSFAKISDRRYLEVEPSTIDVVELPGAMTLAEFADRFPSTVDLEQLAILNGMTSQERLEKGTMVKRVVGGELPER